MNIIMPHKSLIAGLALAIGQFLTQPDAQAYPQLAAQNGNSCSVCHGPYNATSAPLATGRSASGLISVSGFGKLTDLGTQLDGKTRGSLKTFEGVAGAAVQLSVDVVSLTNLAPNPIYALQLKRLEKSGQAQSLTNFLGWSDNNTPGNWVRQGTTNFYYTKTFSNGETGTFAFQLGLSANTPADVYDLEFAIAGKDDTGLFYQDTHYYVAVIDPKLFTDQAVTWSAALASAGYVLEVSDNAGGPWQTYQGATAVIEGDNVVLMKTAQGSKKFFRLQKP